MWEQYKEDFIDFMEAVFKAYKLTALYNLQIGRASCRERVSPYV